MDAVKATEVFFSEYNLVHKDNFMTAPEGVGYCLAVKKEDDK